MNEFAKIMSDEDLHKLKGLSVDLKKYYEYLEVVKNSLSNDWRRAKDFLAKVVNDQRKIETLEIETKKIMAEINSALGEKV